MRKCSYCDDKNEKSIDTLHDEYVKVKASFYHADCYKIYLMTKARSKMKEEDAIVEVSRLKEITSKEMAETLYKEKLFQWMQDYYKIPFPTRFFLKVNNVTLGQYKGISNAITYFELYEMYSNRKMIERLEALAYSKNMKLEDRLDWDFGVMVNEYPNYVKAKLKKKKLESSTQEAIDNMNKYKLGRDKRFERQRELTIKNNEESVNVNDLVSDIFDF